MEITERLRNTPTGLIVLVGDMKIIVEKYRPYYNGQNKIPCRGCVFRDEGELKKLLRSSTGLKVFEARYVGCYNGFISLSDEAILDKAHITFYRGSWDCNNGGIYKICIYTPSIGNRANVPYIQSIVRKITNALDIRFGKDGWNECNQSLLERWRPLSRFSFYLQLPNFRDIITGTSSAKQV